jgi:hypothetical protein
VSTLRAWFIVNQIPLSSLKVLKCTRSSACLYMCRPTGCSAAIEGNIVSERFVLGILGALGGPLNCANSASTLTPAGREGSIALPLLALDGSQMISTPLVNSPSLYTTLTVAIIFPPRRPTESKSLSMRWYASSK